MSIINMKFWFCFGIINLLLCLGDIYRQGFCKAVDLLSTLVMFLSGPFGTIMVVLHYNAEKVNNILEITVWRKKREKTYNDFLNEAQERRKN